MALLLVSCGSGYTLIPADTDFDIEQESEIPDGDEDATIVEHQCFENEISGPVCGSETDCFMPNYCGLPPEGYGYECRSGICLAIIIEPTDGDLDLDDFDPDMDPELEESDGDGADLDEGEEEVDPDDTEADELDWPDCVFCPKDTGLTCGELPEEGEVSNIFEWFGDNKPWAPGSNNGEWLAFRYLSPEYSDYSQLYGCNLLNEKLYLLLDNQQKIIYHSMQDSLIVIWQGAPDNSLTGNLLIANIEDWELTYEFGTASYSTYRFPFLHYPYITFTEDKGFTKAHSGFLHAYDISNGEAVEQRAFAVDYQRHDGHEVIVEGFPEQSSSAYTWGTWMADLPELEFSPMVLGTSGDYGTDFDGEWAVFMTTREALPYLSWFHDSMEIYLFNRRTRREIPLTNTPHRNERYAFIEYPYVGYAQNEQLVADGVGPIEIVHLETGEKWNFANTHTDDVQVLRDRMIGMVNNGNTVQMIRLPEAGRIPDDADCNDDNPCTDDYWWVSLPGCHHENNHDRCSDGNQGTPLDVCIGGVCTGLIPGNDEAETIEIPAGGFWWGTDAVPETEFNPGRVWEGPRRWLELPSFSIDKYEVTNRQYAACVDAGACADPKRIRSGREMNYWGNPAYDDYPVLYVDWFEARNYCEWNGKRLPTEQEWTKAARGSEEAWIYPWGDTVPTSDDLLANLEIDLGLVDDAIAIGSFETDVSPYGVYDLGGNVNEWTASSWTPESLDGEATWGMDLIVIKGGNWRHGRDPQVDRRVPTTPWSASFFTGFRCAKD